MITKDKIINLVEEKLAGTDNFLVEVTVSSANKINILLDSDSKGLSINDCVQVSRYVEQNLDREENDFELLVSSSGADQPLKLLRQYKKHIGKEVQVITSTGEKISGILKRADESGIEVEERKKEKVAGKKSKQLVINNISLTHDRIKETRVVISFK